jgi:hypothetical protein
MCACWGSGGGGAGSMTVGKGGSVAESDEAPDRLTDSHSDRPDPSLGVPGNLPNAKRSEPLAD